MLDPEITLFGRKIQLKGKGGEGEGEGEIVVDEDSPRTVDNFNSDCHHEDEIIKEVTEEESTENNDQHDDSLAEIMDESAISETTDKTNKQPDSEKDSESQQDEKESNDPNDSQQKLLKKPDKILPCPRCNSMDTKFCYYNNYNVNQPRHFCKSCQRYWTAGGTMRNVPVGAGRRKNKTSASRYCHVTVPDNLQANLKTNGTVLTFGPDNQFYEPVTSVIKIAEKTVLNRDDGSSGSTVTTSSIEVGSDKGVKDPRGVVNGFTSQIPCLQWPYMWNPVASPVIPAVIPVPIYPNWNGAPIHPMNVPWVVPHCPSPSPVSNSVTLGKHMRDGEDGGFGSNNTVLMPKTLRIDNPDDAAKSSIWSTLGIKKDKGDSVSKGFFNSFQSKEVEKRDGELEGPSSLIKANPVALCRSLSFQERA